MSRKLAYIAEIDNIAPIEGADRIEVATLKGHGWRVVVGKGDFHPGDLCVMHEIDSFINADDPRYAFLRDRCLRKFVSKGGNVLREGIRIKTCKLRGVVSQGLLMPLDKFPEVTDCIVWSDEAQRDLFSPPEGAFVRRDAEGAVSAVSEVVGADVTDLLHIEHYDEVAEQLRPAQGNPTSADAMGSFPSAYIPKTDEERLANLTDWFQTMRGRRWQVTVKADGTSCTIAYSPSIDAENPFIVCSRNLRLKRETAAGSVPVYWQMAEKHGLLEKLKSCHDEEGRELAIQGEIVGPGINGDRNKETEFRFKCFRIWDITKQEFLDPNQAVMFCRKMEIPHVEVLVSDFQFFEAFRDYDAAMEFAQGKTAEGNEREGVVLKTCDGGQYCSCKIVSNRYLMKQQD